MPTRDGALSRAATFFDDGGFKALLTDLVAIPSTAQEEGARPISTATSTAPSGPGWSGSASPCRCGPTRWRASARS